MEKNQIQLIIMILSISVFYFLIVNKFLCINTWKLASEVQRFLLPFFYNEFDSKYFHIDSESIENSLMLIMFNVNINVYSFMLII